MQKNISGIRAGEKLHEEMITQSDSINTVDLGKYYAILPGQSKHDYKTHALKNGLKYEKMSNGFSYNSGTNTEFLTVNELRDLIIKHITPDFKPRH